MREIKFRAWNGIVYRMSKPFTLRELNQTDNLQYNLTFMQYTGLKDKNGVEIYEGDIVKGYFKHKTWKKKTKEFVGKVYWDKITLSFEVNVPYSHVLVNGYCNDIEVIGNIYENPELLKDS